MKLLLCGIRGTSPVTGTAHAEFGGDTTALLIEGAEGARLVLDMGTGLRLIDRHLRGSRQPRQLDLFLTHYHLDHLIGLPAFAPLYDAAWRLNIQGPRLDGFGVADVLTRILDRPFWPQQIKSLHADIHFTDLEDAPPTPGRPVGGLRVRWLPVHHPGGCVAYRIDEPHTGAALVFATDLEWQASSKSEQARFLEFCATPHPADLLLFDGQFSPQNSARHRGWGHSSWKDAVEVAGAAGVRRLCVIHHAPEKDDRALQAVEREVVTLCPNARLGRQGQQIELPMPRDASP